MKVTFLYRKLENAFRDSQLAMRYWGPEIGRRYVERINVLYEAADTSQLAKIRSLSYHKLRADRRGYYAITLQGRWRLILMPGNDPADIEVVEVSNHYDD